jgi:lipoprotein-anchoring transpeptidase ErfK/SrfK
MRRLRTTYPLLTAAPCRTISATLLTSGLLLLLGGFGQQAPAVPRSEHSTETYRSVALGLSVSARTPVRCLGGIEGAPTANRSFVAVVRTLATAYAGPGSTKVIERFKRIDQNGYPTVFGILGVRADRSCTPTWYRVQLPVVPNGSTGWIPARSVQTFAVTSRIVVDLGARRLIAYRSGRQVLSTLVAIGAPETPTPTGRYFVNERFVLSDPDGPFGVAALGISAHSTVLHDWVQGGPIGLHGTNEPSTIGQATSHGCIRLSNASMQRLLALAPAGTPVSIRP